MKQQTKRIELKLIFEEIREGYKRNLANVDKIDSKIVQLFSFITAILVLVVSFISFPSNFWLILFYCLAAILFIIALFLLIIAYKPKVYNSIDYNKMISEYEKNKWDELDILKNIAGRKAADINSIKEIKKKKSTLFNLCSYLTLAGIMFMIILKIFQGV